MSERLLPWRPKPSPVRGHAWVQDQCRVVLRYLSVAVAGGPEVGQRTACNPTIFSTEAGPDVVCTVRGRCRHPAQSLARLSANMQLQA